MLDPDKNSMDSQELKDVMVIGGSGNLGPSILDALTADSTFKVSVLARKSSTYTYPSNVKVYQIEDSYPEKDLIEAFRGRDAIVCTVNWKGALQEKKFIDAAIETGVKWFLPAEYGANKEASKHGEPLPIHDVKKEVLEYLVKMESKRLSWTAIETGPFLDWGIENGFLGFDIKAKQAKIYGSGDERWTGTTLPTIGLSVARLLQKPYEFQNKFMYVYSVATCQNEILSSLESLTGTKWETNHVQWKDEIPAARKRLESGDITGGFTLVLSYFLQPGMGADFSQDVEAANKLLDLPTETLKGIVSQVLASK